MVHLYVGLLQLAFHKVIHYHFSFCQTTINLSITVFTYVLKWVVITSTSLFSKLILSLLLCGGKAVKYAILVASTTLYLFSANLTLNPHIIFFV